MAKALVHEAAGMSSAKTLLASINSPPPQLHCKNAGTLGKVGRKGGTHKCDDP